ncbi:MAG: MBOAT family protein [Thauera propionica]|nr:MBOAT family protein [Thauera propionica]
MLFTSLTYVFLFLPASFGVYFWLNRCRLVVAARAWLVAASLFFYAWWNPVYLPLILLSVLVNHVLGNEIGRRRGANGKRVRGPGAQAVLMLGISVNLVVLGFFKYADFFVHNVNLASGAGLDLPGIVLPLAISFFTFQQIAYLVDCYREGPLEYDLPNYALFITFFPQLIAGPIVHHREMMPQFAAKAGLVRRYDNIAAGLFLFSVGLFKKVVIADSFAVWAAPGFDDGVVLNFFEAWVTSLSYTFQLYFDFSGYTDMALGAALLFNIRLPANFDSPYKSCDIRDFWRRWHMTLSRFLRDYLYIPLGGSRHGVIRTYLALVVTFLLGGFWHGASWMFVTWGALHGGAAVAHRLWGSLGLRMPDWMGWVLTFNFVNLAWVFFRAPDLEAAMRILRGMAGMEGVVLPGSLAGPLAPLAGLGIRFGVWMDPTHWPAVSLAAILAALAGVLLLPNSNCLWRSAVWRERAARPVWAVSFALLFTAAVVTAAVSSDIAFLYFNF